MNKNPTHRFKDYDLILINQPGLMYNIKQKYYIDNLSIYDKEMNLVMNIDDLDTRRFIFIDQRYIFDIKCKILTDLFTKNSYNMSVGLNDYFVNGDILHKDRYIVYKDCVSNQIKYIDIFPIHIKEQMNTLMYEIEKRFGKNYIYDINIYKIIREFLPGYPKI